MSDSRKRYEMLKSGSLEDPDIEVYGRASMSGLKFQNAGTITVTHYSNKKIQEVNKTARYNIKENVQDGDEFENAAIETKRQVIWEYEKKAEQ